MGVTAHSTWKFNVPQVRAALSMLGVKGTSLVPSSAHMPAWWRCSMLRRFPELSSGAAPCSCACQYLAMLAVA